MVFVYAPNGVVKDKWTPADTGGEFALSPSLAPLSNVKDELVVFTNLCQDNGKSKGDGPGDHARGTASFLTGEHPYKTSGTAIRVGVSVDQVAASQIGHQTWLPSLELGIEPGPQAGDCDSGYSCAYSNSISWNSANTPIILELDE